MANAPALSAVLCCIGEFDSVRKTIRHLAAQTAVADIELILVCSPTAAAGVDSAEMDRLPRWRLFVLENLLYNAVGWAAGIKAASAPAVVLTEDHSFPDPTWAAELIRCHRNGHPVIAPVIDNGNPLSTTSRVNFLLCFVEWFRLPASGSVPRGPGHNTCYDRDLLLRFCKDLADDLTSESALHERLAAAGHQAYFTKDARTSHVNISLLPALLAQSFIGGRIFGEQRAKDWPLVKRLIYAAAFPLVPPLRLSRILALLPPSARAEIHLYSLLPLTCFALLLHALGEACGYVFGARGSMLRYQAFESFRSRFVCAADKALLIASAPPLPTGQPTVAPSTPH